MGEFQGNDYEEDATEFSDRSFVSGFTPLVLELIEDLRLLIQQEVSLVRAELREEGQKAGRILKWSTVSVALGVIAGALLMLACVFGVQSALPGAPLWSCFGLIGAMLGIGAMAIYLWGTTRWRELELMPHRTLRSLRESLSWLRR